MKTKFKIGDKVVCKADTTCEVHKILGYATSSQGVTYRVTSRELDVASKSVVEGISHFKEKELKFHKPTHGNKTK